MKLAWQKNLHKHLKSIFICLSQFLMNKLKQPFLLSKFYKKTTKEYFFHSFCLCGLPQRIVLLFEYISKSTLSDDKW